MARKTVKIEIAQSGNKVSVSVNPWNVELSKGTSDEIEWTLDRDFTIDLENSHGNFNNTPSKVKGNSANPAKTGKLKGSASNGRHAYEIETTDPNGDPLTLDPGYRVSP